VDTTTILENVRHISAEFAKDRRERQVRRHLEPVDFEQLREAGYLLTAVPVEHGGAWKDLRHSLRPVCEILRVLAHGDPSVALVATMHPCVILTVGWLTLERAPDPYEAIWDEQRRWVFESARNGAWWGTIVSEPGSGGAVQKTRATASIDRPPMDYRITGQKHFGSGSGVASYMITTAVPEGETDPDIFYMDMRDVPWDGSAGITLVGAWDGHGMAATQSHGMRFDQYPGTRAAWPGHQDRKAAAMPEHAVDCLFSAVFVGIVETALVTARQQLGRRREGLGAFEQVEWTRAEMEGWLIQQAHQGMLREVEEQTGQNSLYGKTAIAELSASVLDRLCKILGGGTFARQSPFGFWLQDVRALGFLRPPWSLAFDNMYESIPPEPASETIRATHNDNGQRVVAGS
jgi:alkylation response protein AidB-like acyl-CoA dehydrogenase